MFDSLKNLFSKNNSDSNAEVYVEIPLDDFKKEEEIKRQREDIGLAIPQRIESFRDLQLQEEAQNKKKAEAELLKKKKEEAERSGNVILVEMDKEEKRLQEMYKKTHSDVQLRENDSLLYVDGNTVSRTSSETSNETPAPQAPESVSASVGNHYVLNAEKTKKSETNESISGDLKAKLHEVQNQSLPQGELNPSTQKTSQKIAKPMTREAVHGIEHDIKFFFKSVAYFIGSLIFITLALYLFYFSNTSVSDVQNIVTRTFSTETYTSIRADENITLSIDSNKVTKEVRSDILQFLFNQQIKFDKLVTLTPEYVKEVQNGDQKTTVKNNIRGDEFMFIMFPNASLALRTVAADRNTIGAVNITSQNENFIALSVSNTPVAYKELIIYEKDMYNDLKDVFNLRTPVGKISFKDVSINNHIMRALVDDDGLIFVYGFADTRTVVFAPNANVFEKVYERLK